MSPARTTFEAWIKSAVALTLLCMASCTTRLADQPIGSDAGSNITAGSFRLSAENTRITFIGTAIANSHEGEFTRFSGVIRWPGQDVNDRHLSVTIEMDSVFTKIDLLTRHLKAEDFFDVAKFPIARFESTQVSAEGDHFVITGNLTLHGVTQPIAIQASVKQAPGHLDMDARFFIRQSRFNMQSARTTTDDVPVKVQCRIGSREI